MASVLIPAPSEMPADSESIDFDTTSIPDLVSSQDFTLFSVPQVRINAQLNNLNILMLFFSHLSLALTHLLLRQPLLLRRRRSRRLSHHH